MFNDNDHLKICSSEFDATFLAELTQGQSLLALWFTGVESSGQDLPRFNLQGACFERGLFAGSNLIATKLICNEWLNCQSAPPMFRSTLLVDDRFVSCNLSNTQWQHTELTHASFGGCKLTDANFIEIYNLALSFSESVLHSAYLSGLLFYKSQLSGLDFVDSDLSY